MAPDGGLSIEREAVVDRADAAAWLAIDPGAPGAYQWWYFDATSADGATSLVVIFFVGSVFSPWYAQRLNAGERAEPRGHCAVNVAVYQRGTLAWAFSEYPAFETQHARDGAARLGVGRSRIERDARGWTLSLDEAEPWTHAPVRGTARFEPVGPVSRGEPLVLDAHGRHRWQPVAPRCAVRAELQLARSSIAFEGTGYHDVNHGDRPLAEAFTRWTWARTHEPSGRTVIGYDRTLRDGPRRVLSLVADANGGRTVDDRVVAHEDTPEARGAWGLEEPRTIELASAGMLQHLERLDGSPFYARFTGRTASGGRAVAERLDLARFSRGWVRALLPFRARRCALP